MKKIDKKGIVKLIIFIILLIIQIRAFDNSRANKLTYVTAKITDLSGLLSEETSTMIAINEADSGIAITLPDFVNTKKVSKYIVTKKEITQSELETENETEIGTETTTETDVLEDGVEETITEETNPEQTTEGTLETVELLPGEKVYLTQEEIDSLEIALTVQYDTIEVETQTLYNKKLTVTDADDYELLSVLGYMPYDTVIEIQIVFL